MIFAIDFDGTIVEHKYPMIGELKPNAKEVINKLVENNHKIIIWTCRYLAEDLKVMTDFLYANAIKFHAVNCNAHSIIDFCPEPKIYADYYIDDRDIMLIGQKINWFDIERKLLDNNIIRGVWS
jgi:hydroxymethylpyrimidine pyrophosphatase-like HAD family hydrolase